MGGHLHERRRDDAGLLTILRARALTFRCWSPAANSEHFFSFFLTCVLALGLNVVDLNSLFYDAEGALKPGMERFGQGMTSSGARPVLAGLGGAVELAFLLMGVAMHAAWSW